MMRSSEKLRPERLAAIRSGGEALVIPLHGLRTRVAHDPGVDLDDEVGLLSERHEVRGRQQAQSRMLPSHERLDADDVTRCAGRSAADRARAARRDGVRCAARCAGRDGSVPVRSCPRRSSRVQLPPASLARCIAVSAFRSSWPACVPSSGKTAMPTLAVMNSSCPSTTNGRLTAARSCSASDAQRLRPHRRPGAGS